MMRPIRTVYWFSKNECYLVYVTDTGPLKACLLRKDASSGQRV